MAARASGMLVSRRSSAGYLPVPRPSLPYGRDFVTVPVSHLPIKMSPITSGESILLKHGQENVVEIYGKPGCGLTDKYAQTLNKNGIDVTQYVVGIDVDEEDVLDLVGASDINPAESGPWVFVNGEFSLPVKDRSPLLHVPTITAKAASSLPYGRSFARLLHTHVSPVQTSFRGFSRLSDARLVDDAVENESTTGSTFSPFNTIASREQANKWLKEGQYTKAEEEYGRLLRNDAGTYTTYSNRATARFFQNKFELAAQDAKVVIEMEPAHVKGYLRLTSCLRAQKRFEVALQTIGDAIASAGFEAGSTSEQHLLREQDAIEAEIENHDNHGFGYFFPEDGDPDVAWMLMKKQQKIEKVDVATLSSGPMDASKLRVVCVSDTHGRHRALGKIPEGDVLVCAGDFTEMGSLQEVEEFSAWLKRLPHTHKIVIAGNHDVTFEPETYLDSWDRFHKVPQDPFLAKKTLEASGCIYLEDSSFEVEGVKFFGTPHQPEFNNWAFNSKRGSECRSKWDQIPADTDVLISHGPPLGHGDALGKKKKAGCVDLLHSVQQVVRPALHVFGHVHEGYGATTDGKTTYVNASVTSDDEWCINECIVVDLDRK